MLDESADLAQQEAGEIENEELCGSDPLLERKREEVIGEGVE
jgi:hypothetical protein